MKKVFLSLTVTALLIACGGGDSEKKTPFEVKTDTKTDVTQNPDYQKGMAIVAKQENLCLTCHKVEEKLVGPAYRDVANKYENNEENINKLAEKVTKGGKGVWGEVPMPENKVISLEDAKAAVKYVLMLRNK
ncbi:MAG TPA: cytochrome c class I [Chitinophagaceae bacterium]|jgi:cytochrome c|nr:cytochrome c class I [Chitinophagaceae bacterium]HMU59221.1 cytochrome c class I [Chitinophagaceae bacterium]